MIYQYSSHSWVIQAFYQSWMNEIYPHIWFTQYLIGLSIHIHPICIWFLQGIPSIRPWFRLRTWSPSTDTSACMAGRVTLCFWRCAFCRWGHLFWWRSHVYNIVYIYNIYIYMYASEYVFSKDFQQGLTRYYVPCVIYTHLILCRHTSLIYPSLVPVFPWLSDLIHSKDHPCKWAVLTCGARAPLSGCLTGITLWIC